MAEQDKPAGEKIYRVVCVGVPPVTAPGAAPAASAPRTRVIRMCSQAEARVPTPTPPPDERS